MIEFENGTLKVQKNKDKIKLTFKIEKDKLSSIQIELELDKDQASELITNIVTEKNKL